MKPASGGSRFGRNRFRIVYVNRFGSHRCGNVIHYGGGHLREDEGKVAALSNAISCSPNKAHSPISKGPGSWCAVLSPSPEGQKSPCFGSRATSKKQGDGNGIRVSQSLTREEEAKSPKATRAKRIMAEPPLPPNKDWSCQAAALIPTASSSQNETGMRRESAEAIA
ncbi:hypothetical protein JD844_012022 [Phrynosoma platyrhinos]|uniref:Uncharacterized protein n=1 Tax=Phrynosoma platyrhinos TaxID=52577 RepID=A0ABQ7TKN2_PHRPL|nr:hypothetical protein JD844_012022 [Phrynosoma platyrhinos]